MKLPLHVRLLALALAMAAAILVAFGIYYSPGIILLLVGCGLGMCAYFIVQRDELGP